MIANKSWRLPGGGEAAPRRARLLLSHVFTGFSLPPHPFFRGIMNHFGAQLHHFPPNAIAHLASFVTLCECFMGCPPHWGLFKYIFSARSQTIKKLSQSDDKTHLLQLCGGLGFQKKTKSSYPPLQLSESVKAAIDLEWTNWYSPVSNGNPAEEEEGGQEGSVDSAEYVSDSGETEEETEEEEGEVGEQSPPPPPSEPRTKRRHEPAAPPAPPVAPSAPPASPVAPSARSVKRTRDAAAEPTDQPSKVAKPSGPKLRKALPRMRIIVPVASSAATSATSLPRQDDDPMDTDNAATSQQVGLPSEVIHLEGDDRRGLEPALAPILEVVPSAAAPTTSVPPTETMPPTETVPPTEMVPLAAEPTGAELGMPKESSVVPGPSTFQYDARHFPDDQVGAAKEAMVQVELMVGDAKGAYDSITSLYKRSLELRDDIRKTCEMGSAYNALKAEKIQLVADLEAAVNDLAGVKGALADREKSLEESRETNKALVAEIEKLKSQRTERMAQLKLMNNRCMAQEKYVSDWARKMIALLAGKLFDECFLTL
ncbi:hypothetical protein ZWY2020_058403 [Hordeum vulgare]|nr:hypothetical protein ZWY2020_058403 [Hordeum vulgare]